MKKEKLQENINKSEQGKQRKQINPDLVTSYKIQPGNKVSEFHSCQAHIGPALH